MNPLLQELQNLQHGTDVTGIILFGSMARGEARPDSDIDLCIILKQMNEPTINKLGEQILDLEKQHRKKIQVIFTDRHFSQLDRNLLENLVSEGVILSGTLPPVSIQQLQLTPYIIIRYDLRELTHNQKMIIKREIYGQVTTKRYNDKQYRSEKVGLATKLGAERIGIATLMVKEKDASQLISLLEALGGKVRILKIWVSRI